MTMYCSDKVLTLNFVLNTYIDNHNRVAWQGGRGAAALWAVLPAAPPAPAPAASSADSAHISSTTSLGKSGNPPRAS